jgi:hypothetical protein
MLYVVLLLVEPDLRLMSFGSTDDRILDPTGAAKSVGIGDWKSEARLTTLGHSPWCRSASHLSDYKTPEPCKVVDSFMLPGHPTPTIKIFVNLISNQINIYK